METVESESGEQVSIHALLAECDCERFVQEWLMAGFNPRTPCGVRLRDVRAIRAAVQVSIHALLAECDMMAPAMSSVFSSFNPRTPCGVRPA